MIVAIDLTKHLDALASMRTAQQQQFRSTFEDAPIGMALTSIDGRILSVNVALAKLSGRPGDARRAPSRAAAARRRAHDGQRGPDDDGAVRRVVARHLRDAHRAREGTTRWVAVHTSVVHDDDGNPLHLLRQFEDVTERRKFAEQLEHLGAARSAHGAAQPPRPSGELAGLRGARARGRPAVRCS